MIQEISVWAENGTRETIPADAQSDGSVSYDQGWTAAYATNPALSGARNLTRAQMNGVLYDLSAAIKTAQVSINGGMTAASEYGAVPDGVLLDDAAMTAGSATLTSASATFSAADVGKLVVVWRAGTGGLPLYSTISGYVSATVVTLATAAATTVSGKRAAYGTDNSAAFASALAASAAVYAGQGVYLFGSQLAPTPLTVGRRMVFPSLRGSGMEATTFIPAFDAPLLSLQGTGTAIYLGWHGAYTIEGRWGIKAGDRTETIANGTGQAPKLSGIIEQMRIVDQSTSGGGGGAIPTGIGIDLAKTFDTTVRNCVFETVGYGVVLTGCDSTLTQGCYFNSCRYGSWLDKSAQSFDNGSQISECRIVGPMEATATVIKSTGRKPRVINNEIECGGFMVCFDFSGIDWPDLFGENVDTGPYIIDCSGNSVDIAPASSGYGYRIETSTIFSMRLENLRWAGLAPGCFLDGGSVVTSVPAVADGVNVVRFFLGPEGEAFGDEWSNFQLDNIMTERSSSVAAYSARTIDAVWPGWGGNESVRFRGPSLVLPIVYSGNGLYLIPDFASDAGPDKVYVPGRQYEIEVWARTTIGTDTITLQYQRQDGPYLTDAATSHAIGATWTRCLHGFVAGTGVVHGPLINRTTAIGEIEIKSIVVRQQLVNPAFQAQIAAVSSNVTGDGTAYTVVFGTEVIDVGGNYDTSTGIFTAPLTGRYRFSAAVSASGISAGHTDGKLELNTSNRTYRFEANPAAIKTSSNRATLMLSLDADMDKGDTAYITLTVYNSTKTVGVSASGAAVLTGFSGAYIADGGAI